MDVFALLVVSIVFGSLLAGLAIICWLIVKLVGPRNTGVAGDEEARLMQELYQGLLRLEQRVEALEMLLYEPGERPRR